MKKNFRIKYHNFHCKSQLLREDNSNQAQSTCIVALIFVCFIIVDFPYISMEITVFKKTTTIFNTKQLFFVQLNQDRTYPLLFAAGHNSDNWLIRYTF